jgi:hypothetical protein
LGSLVDDEVSREKVRFLKLATGTTSGRHCGMLPIMIAIICSMPDQVRPERKVCDSSAADGFRPVIDSFVRMMAKISVLLLLA